MLQPPSLKYNDRAVIISPSGNIDEYIVQDALSVFEEWGLLPEIGDSALGKSGRFSGSISQRLDDLQNAFDDPCISLVLCSRGGYGLVHLLPDIDFTGIRRNPKWVVGYSDISALHAALQSNGIASIHGPMAKHFSDEGAEDVSVRYLKSILSGQSVDYQIPVTKHINLNRCGFASGRLFGGNLSVFCGLLGSKYIKIPKNGILFIEDVGEEPYKVDRMIHQLKLAGVFDRISGMIIGQFTDYEEDETMYSDFHSSIFEVVKQYDFPICFNFPVGHVRLNFPLVMGLKASLLINEDYISFKQLIRNQKHNI